jgi:hypothetical protein
MRGLLKPLVGVVLGCGAIFGGAASADPALTNAPAVMRTAPSPKAQVVQQVPANAQIDLSGCSGGWCYASWRDLFGYLPVRIIGPQPYRPAAPPPPSYGGPAVEVASVFGWGFYGPGWRRW